MYPKLKTALSSQASLDERSAQTLELSILAKTNAIGMQTPVYGIVVITKLTQYGSLFYQTKCLQ